MDLSVSEGEVYIFLRDLEVMVE